MREILFRGKRTDNGEWVYGYYTKARYFLDNKEMHIIFEPDAEAFPHCEFPGYEEVLPETVGQYTGLTDKNGRKIFEGDIMRNAGNVVEFYGGDFCINGDSPLSYWTGTEIIGNIYDNPELLKGGMKMAEYIDKSAVVAKIDEFVEINKANGFPVDIFDMEMLKKRIEQIPAADVAPVVHGRWEMKSEDTTPGIYHVKKAFCTRCGKSNKQYRPPYCPHCGAKMDEEVKK